MRNALAISMVLLSLLASGQSAPSGPPIVPMAKGTSWVYSARVKFGKAGTDVAGTKTLRWTVTIIDTAQKDDVSAALLKGGPWDLAWYEPAVKPQEHLIVRLGSTYYLLHDDAAATLAEIKAGKVGDLKDRLADDVWFQVPMEISDHYCSPEAEERAPMDCWSVEKITTTHSLKVSGLKATPEATEYLLTFMTNPDTEMVTLVPGVGILSWWYQHHGTVAEASLKLVEFRRAPRTSDPFEQVRRELQHKTTIPIRLPRTVADLADEAPSIFVAGADNKHYEVQIADTPDCNGAHVCSFGHVSAYRETAQVSEDIQRKSKSVELNPAITGHFIPPSVGSYCSDAILWWKEIGGTYVIASKCGSERELVELAKSAVAAAAVRTQRKPLASKH